MIWIVTTQSGISSSLCFLGCGKTCKDAVIDAYGENRKLPRDVWVDCYQSHEIDDAILDFPDFETEIRIISES